MKKISIFIAVIMFIFILSACTSNTTPSFYSGTVSIVTVNEIEVYAIDTNGELWSWKCNNYFSKGWKIGQVCNVIWSDNGTPDNIYDDIIINIY